MTPHTDIERAAFAMPFQPDQSSAPNIVPNENENGLSLPGPHAMHQRSDNTLLARSSLRRNIVVCKKLLMTRTLFRTESAYHVATSTLPTMTDHKPLFRRTPLTLRSLFLLEHILQSLIAWENV